MRIREATESDMDDVLAVERAAFGEEAEAELVRALLADPTSEPALSLLAFDGDRAVGHILFTATRLDGGEGAATSAILAPLAVVPDAQKRGIGGKLIARGLELLRDAGVDLVFVLGWPGYYPRHGFAPAGRHGLHASYPILDKNADAWMVQELRPGVIGTVTGRLLCADSLMRPEYWVE